MPSPPDLIVFDITEKTKHTGRPTYMLLFDIPYKQIGTKINYCSKIYNHTKFQVLMLNGASIAFISELRTVAILVLTVGNCKGKVNWESGGIAPRILDLGTRWR
jgi:hypothetical protein